MKDENYERKLYIIPVNISDDTGYKGFSYKRIGEGVVTFIIAFLLWKFIFFSFGLIVKFIAFMCLVVPLTAIAFMGIKGETLFEFLIEWVVFMKKRRKMIYKIPRKQVEKKRFGRAK